jgi:AraC-like DNA-binding protein
MATATHSGAPDKGRTTEGGIVPQGMVRVAPMREAFAVLRELGVEPDAILAEFGLQESYFGDQDNTVPYVIVGMFLKRCAEVTNCRHFGVLGGARLSASNLGVVGFLMQSARDLRASLTQGARFFRFHNPNATVQLTETGNVAAWRFSLLMRHLEGREHILEAAMANSVNTMRKLCGPKWEPLEVRLASPEPTDKRPYARAFGRLVRFNQADTELLFASHWLDTPLPSADAALQEAMLKQLGALETAKPEDLMSQVRRMLPSLVSARAASLELVASLMGVSGRTLGRRLAAEGTTYMRLREEARYVAACQLLESTRMPANEISDRLGYSNPSAFTRAFCRWSGKAPADWRLSRRAPHPDGDTRSTAVRATSRG